MSQATTTTTTTTDKRKKPEIEDKKKEDEIIDLSNEEEQEEEETNKKKTKTETTPDSMTKKAYRDMLAFSPNRLDEIEQELLPYLRDKMPVVRGKPLEWQEEVTVADFSNPDGEFCMPQFVLQLFRSKFYFTSGDYASRQWIEVCVFADPIHCRVYVATRLSTSNDWKEESSVPLPSDNSAERFDAVDSCIRESFEEIFDDIYSDELAEEEEAKTPAKTKSAPAAQAPEPKARILVETDDEDDEDEDEDKDNDDDNDEDKPMPDVVESKKKQQGKVPVEMVQKIEEILDHGLFRRTDYGELLMMIRSSFDDSSAWSHMLEHSDDPAQDRNSNLCERRRIWARVTEGKSLATDRELQARVREYNAECVQLQALRLECIKEMADLRPELTKTSTHPLNIHWRRYMRRLACSILNLENMTTCITLGISPSDYSWKDVREVLEDRMLAPGQVLPPLDSAIVHDPSKEKKLLEKAWTPVKKAIQASDFASSIL